MGMLGKIFVMLHAVLSLGMLTWAVGVYTQRIKWSSPNKEDPGVFDRQKAKQEDLADAMNRAYYRWTGNYASVDQFERQRFPRRVFYASQLNLVSTGTATGAPGAPVVDPAVLEPTVSPQTGFLDISGQARRPVAAPMGGNLKSIAGYEKDMAKVYEDIAASQKKNNKLLVDRELLNNEIIGVTKPALVKGLRQQINEQKLIEDEATTEIAYVGSFATIREAEFGLLKKRRDALTLRMTELKKYLDSKVSASPK